MLGLRVGSVRAGAVGIWSRVVAVVHGCVVRKPVKERRHYAIAVMVRAAIAVPVIEVAGTRAIAVVTDVGGRVSVESRD
jgi:hypothetical protein